MDPVLSESEDTCWTEHWKILLKYGMVEGEGTWIEH